MTLTFNSVKDLRQCPPLRKNVYFRYCCLCASSLSRIRTQALKYSKKDASSDEKIGFRLKSPSLKKGFYM